MTSTNRIVWGKNETVPLMNIPSVVLCDPKHVRNVGSAIRNCSAYGIDQLWFTGNRVSEWITENSAKRLPREERMKGYGSVTAVNFDYPFDVMPKEGVPVAIEIGKGFVPLTLFEHPLDAVYVFGPEDGSIPSVISRHCHHHVYIPSHHCLNLAVAIGTVLFSRIQYIWNEFGEIPRLKEQRGFSCELEDQE
jgi:tRNA(Leu) C34 or U34 (ribose-2'-O)-methylase TrmL